MLFDRTNRLRSGSGVRPSYNADDNDVHRHARLAASHADGWEHLLEPLPIYKDAALFFGLAGMVYSPTVIVAGHVNGSKEYFRPRQNLLSRTRSTYASCRARSFSPARVLTARSRRKRSRSRSWRRVWPTSCARVATARSANTASSRGSARTGRSGRTPRPYAGRSPESRDPGRRLLPRSPRRDRIDQAGQIPLAWDELIVQFNARAASHVARAARQAATS